MSCGVPSSEPVAVADPLRSVSFAMPEIEHLGTTRRRDEDVVGLEIAMDHALCMRGRRAPVENLRAQSRDPAERQRHLAVHADLDDVRERRAVEVLHDDVRPAIRQHREIEDVHDALVTDQIHGARFAEEAIHGGHGDRCTRATAP